MSSYEERETSRLELQRTLDSTKGQEERNKLGQFATPTVLATEILTYARSMMAKDTSVRFFDPAFGTGAFFSALLTVFPEDQIEKAEGFEIDLHYGVEAAAFWQHTQIEVRLEDFTRALPPSYESERSNLLICNPPYVRHHHMTTAEKARLIARTQATVGMRLSGLSGLYTYFLCLAHAWMADDGLAGWLIPSEFMDVNYGKQIKEYLLTQVTLLHIHRFDPRDVQFDDAFVSSAIVWFRKSPPPSDHQVEFSFGGSLSKPLISKMIPAAVLSKMPKWTRYPHLPHTANSHNVATKMSDLFTIKRGIATGSNEFFIITSDIIDRYRIPSQFLTPILPSPRYLHTDEIESDEHGNPIIDRRQFLLTCDLDEATICQHYPSLWEYLQLGLQKGVDQGYLCQHRSLWYAQERRPAAPIVCTYMGRQLPNGRSPFRFILNNSRATVPNVYLMLYPKPHLALAIRRSPHLLRDIWQELTKMTPATLLGEGRVYGGGLHKIEPKELGNAPADQIVALAPGLELGHTAAVGTAEQFEQRGLFS